MTRLFNDPLAFADELREGFVASHPSHVLAVPGGVVRATVSEPGTVGVVIGGGSGHYPSFAGLVGAGLVSGAAMGNLFASPSAQQVHSVAAASDHGGGLLLTCGNYAGDVLNFTAAAEKLRSEGTDVRTVWVTDDISSSPAGERERRRGIAGGLFVDKVASAAADAGASLDEVERLARHANDRTRTLGVAFSGCTLPGADEPLFTVPEGRMAVGMGIHGEPGISETDIPTADGLAAMLVDALMAELPDDVPAAAGRRASVILNGLGSVKYEELFVVYRAAARLLEEAGVTIVQPEVGEFCTSFDMAGASLTIAWLDEELETLWSAPADAASYRKGSVATMLRTDELPVAPPTQVVIPEASDESRAAAAVVVGALAAAGTVIDQNVSELGRLDAVAGDGDHGIGMQRGVQAAVTASRDALERGAGAGSTLMIAGDAWSDRGGGTSGMLWGVLLRALGEELGDDDLPDATAVAGAVATAVDAVRAAGGASLGDKTMVDALVPFATVLAERAGAGLTIAWQDAADAATDAADATADLLPRRGRARPHAERSRGSADPGARSFAMIAEAIAGMLTRRES